MLNANNYNKYNKSINLIFNFFNDVINTLNVDNIYNDNNNIITYVLLFCLNNIYLLTILHNNLVKKIRLYNKNKEKYIDKILKIEKTIQNINDEILISYNNFNNNSNNLIKNNTLKITYNILPIDSNIDLYSLDNIDDLLHNTDKNKKNYIFVNDNNFIDYKKINIGFGNYYKLHSFQYLNDKLPFNLLMYVQEVDQVLLKIGDENNFQYINSKLYKVYNSKNDKNINSKSIICNNNIKKLNKKCIIENCKYYHDYIIGYKDNYHKERQFSSNPIVYNCIDFKDGSKIKENKKKIEWHDAINLYQASLSNILLGCIHSLK